MTSIQRHAGPLYVSCDDVNNDDTFNCLQMMIWMMLMMNVTVQTSLTAIS